MRFRSSFLAPVVTAALLAGCASTDRPSQAASAAVSYTHLDVYKRQLPGVTEMVPTTIAPAAPALPTPPPPPPPVAETEMELTPAGTWQSLAPTVVEGTPLTQGAATDDPEAMPNAEASAPYTAMRLQRMPKIEK